MGCGCGPRRPVCGVVDIWACIWPAPGQRESAREAPLVYGTGAKQHAKRYDTSPPVSARLPGSASRDCLRLEKRDEWWAGAPHGRVPRPNCATMRPVSPPLPCLTRSARPIGRAVPVVDPCVRGIHGAKRGVRMYTYVRTYVPLIRLDGEVRPVSPGRQAGRHVCAARIERPADLTGPARFFFDRMHDPAGRTDGRKRFSS